MTTLPQTLLQMQGASLSPSALDVASLVLIDLQEEYRSGTLPLPDIGAAAVEAAKVLKLARLHGLPIIHVQHQVGPGSPIFDPDRSGFAIMCEVEPINDEGVVIKRLPNAFAGTDLDRRLREAGRPEIIMVGAMTHMCISATARAALDLGYRTTIVADACATRDLPSIDGERITADAVHRTALAELGDVFAIVVPNAEALTRQA